MSRLKLFIPLIFFILLTVIFWSVLTEKNYDPQDLPSALIGQPMPHFELTTVDSEQIVKTADILGEVFLLNVWATWCITCRVEHAYLNELRQQGVKIIGLDYKDDKAKAQQWIADLGNPYAINLFDGDGRTGLDLGVYGAPETYLVDKKGIIRYKHVGDVNPVVWKEKLKPLYDELIAQ
jgi:cytochrome c biogenesis protein CcmG, thiol:disulfide interchange protein DsbE